MQAVWSGSALNPNVTIPNFAFVNHPLGAAMAANSANPFNSPAACFPLSDSIVITGITAWVATAPGVGINWTLSIQSATDVTFSGTGTFASTAASVTISGTNTSASWTGSVAIAQSAFISVGLIPSGSGNPASTAAVYWVINYQTVGNFYLLPFGSTASFTTNGTGSYYDLAFGLNNTTPTTTATSFAVPIPTNITLTKILVWCNDQSVFNFGGSNKTFSVYNATTSTPGSFSSVVTGATTGLGSLGVGTMSFTAGQLLCVQAAFPVANTPYCADYGCITVVPGNPGEVVMGYAATTAPYNNQTSYEDPNANGANGWNATESTVYTRFPASTLKNLYVALSVAPGAGTGYAFTLRANGSTSTGITSTISGTATTGNDTTDSYILPSGTFLDIQSVPIGSFPAATTVGLGFVQLIAQSDGRFLEIW